MNYIILTFIAWFVSQTLKFIFRYFSKTKDNKGIVWVFLWATGAPSAHTAVLVSNLILLNKDIGTSPVFMFLCIVSGIFMYNLITDRERQKALEEFYREGSESDKRIVASGKILDMSGHSVSDILYGILTGLIIGYLFVYFI